jgi:hypothetical protein
VPPTRLVLAVLAGLLAAALTAPVPVLDEESYLDIARQLDLLRPYDWWRAWQPWGGQREADAYVYAHPPLFLMWVKAWVGDGADAARMMPAWKLAAGLPWAMLLGWSGGRLLERFTRQPLWAGLAWLSAPISLLGLQRGLMPDLMVCALSACAVACWVEGLADSQGRRGGWLRTAGLMLAAAAFTKYAALVLVPVLLLQALRLGRLKQTGWFWLAFLLPLALGEGWLWASYGRPHLVEVLLRAGEIGRGPLLGRLLGVLVRLGALGLIPLALLRPAWRRAAPGALLVGGGLALVGAPEGTPAVDRLLLGPPLRALRAGLRPGSADPDTGDRLLLGAWALLGVAGVVLAHNYAAPRYLLPVMLPLAALLGQEGGGRGSSRLRLGLAAAAQLGLGLLVTVGEHRLFFAQVEAAEAALQRVESMGMTSSGSFSGEWAFRWRLEQAGWTWWDGSALPPGSLVISATQAAPRALPGTWLELGRDARGRAPLRLLRAEAGVGLYGETLGALPLGAPGGMLEEAILWQVP